MKIESFPRKLFLFRNNLCMFAQTQNELHNMKHMSILAVSLLALVACMLHTRWKEQDFLFAMNGQTGKLIGDLPVDKGRVAAWFAGISIPLMILTALIMLL